MNALFGQLAGDLEGASDRRPPLVLLHGLTFDRTMWAPALAALAGLDPGRQVLTLDLPGHGGSPGWPSYDLDTVAAAVHRAVGAAGLGAPVLVGHSLGAVVVSVYAGTYPARGVVNADQPLQTEPFARLVRSIADRLRGPAFAAAFEPFEASMGIGLLPPAAQELLRSSRHLRQDLVLGYWREVLDRPAAEMASRISDGMARLRASGLPYQFVMGHEPDPEYLTWLSRELPRAGVTAWPGSGHFPHLAQPKRFAEVLAATASWP